MPVNNPKKLKVNPNERVDIPDFDRAASDYTQELVGAAAALSQLDSRSRFYEGFRIEATDAANGEITIYNGAGLNVAGTVVSDTAWRNTVNETVICAAASISYIEIEFVEASTDTDNRAFWDPTITNTSPIPDGQEYVRNTSTRTTPGWRVVSPISTSGFDISTNPESVKMPLALIQTNGGGAITNLPSLVPMSSVLEEGAAINDTRVKVLNSQFLPGASLDVVFLHVNGTTTETITLTNNDLNGVLDLGSTLSFAFPKGSIVKTDATSLFIPQRTDAADIEIPFTETGVVAAQPATLPAMDPSTQSIDQAPRMFQGDESRGTALNASKEVAGSRDDLDIDSLKDYVDFLAAQLREVKLGNTEIAAANQAIHPGTLDPNGNTIPTYAAADRYYRHAGGLLGTRSVTLTVGDGINSYGDFNGTDEVPFNLALAALPTEGGIIFIKKGTYTATTVPIGGDIARNVMFVGECRQGTVLTGALADGTVHIESTAIGSVLGFYNMRVINTHASEYAIRVDNTLGGTNGRNVFNLINMNVDGQVFYASRGNTWIDFKQLDISSDVTSLTLRGELGGTALDVGGTIDSLQLSSGSTTLPAVSLGPVGSNTDIRTLEISNSSITGDFSAIQSESSIEKLIVTNCHIEGVEDHIIFHDINSATTQSISYRNCEFECAPIDGTVTGALIKFAYTGSGASDGTLEVRDCTISAEYDTNPTTSQFFIDVVTPRLNNLVIENVVCDPGDADVSDNVTFFRVLGTSSLVRNGLIKNFYCLYGKKCIDILLSSNSVVADELEYVTNFVIDGLVHQGGITIDPQFTIPISQVSLTATLNEVLGNFVVKNSLIFNTGSDNGASPTASAIQITASSTTSSDGLFVTVKDNICSNMASVAGLTVIDLFGTGASTDSFTVRGNNINGNTAATTRLKLITATDCSLLVINDNEMGTTNNLSNVAAAGADSISIEVDGSDAGLQIYNNRMSITTNSISGSTDAYGVKITDSSATKHVYNNTIITSSDRSVNDATGIGIFVGGDGSAECDNVYIHGNNISNATQAILVSATSTLSITRVKIYDNEIQAMSQAGNVIEVISIGGSISQLSISNNTLDDCFNSELDIEDKSGIEVYAHHASLGTISNVIISDNIITTSATLHSASTEKGIHVQAQTAAGSENITITGNMLFGSTSTSDLQARAGIHVQDLTQVIVANNNVDWMRAVTDLTGATDQAQIHIQDCTSVSVTGNVTPGFSAIIAVPATPYGITIEDVDSSVIMGNVLGTAGVTGFPGILNFVGTNNRSFFDVASAQDTTPTPTLLEQYNLGTGSTP